MDCHPRTLVGIAKHLDMRTDKQPTIYELSPCLAYPLMRFGDFTRSEHYLYFQKLRPVERCKDSEKIRIFAEVIKVCTMITETCPKCNSNKVNYNPKVGFWYCDDCGAIWHQHYREVDSSNNSTPLKSSSNNDSKDES